MIKLLESGSLMKSDMFDIVKSNHTLDKLLNSLEDEGFVTMSETVIGRRVYSVSLTPKGKTVADQLKGAQDAAHGTTPAPADAGAVIHERFRNFRALYHFSITGDTIRIADAGVKGKRIADVQVKVVGKNLKLYCDQDRSFDCEHIDFIWVDRSLRQRILERVDKDGLKVWTREGP